MDEFTYYLNKKKKKKNKLLKLKIESTEIKTLTDVLSHTEEKQHQRESSDEYSGVSDLCASLLSNIDANTKPLYSQDAIMPTSPTKKCVNGNNKKTTNLKLDINEMVFDVIDNLSPFTPFQKTPKTPANHKVLWAPPNVLTESTTSPAVDSMLTGSQWWMTPSYNDMKKHPNPVLKSYTPSND